MSEEQAEYRTRHGFENLVTGVKARFEEPRTCRPPVVSTAEVDGETAMVIRLPGEPMGKPRMTRRDKWHKRECATRYWEFAERLRAAAGTVPPVETVIDLSWTATFEPPVSWSKKRRVAAMNELHRSKPDRDNIDKAVLDSLYPGGDSAIAQGTLIKVWGWEASLEVVIRFISSGGQ